MRLIYLFIISIFITTLAMGQTTDSSEMFGHICLSCFPKKIDTVPCNMLCGNTHNGKVFNQSGYAIFYLGRPTLYLNDRKYPLKKNIVVYSIIEK